MFFNEIGQAVKKFRRNLGYNSVGMVTSGTSFLYIQDYCHSEPNGGICFISFMIFQNRE